MSCGAVGFGQRNVPKMKLGNISTRQKTLWSQIALLAGQHQPVQCGIL